MGSRAAHGIGWLRWRTVRVGLLVVGLVLVVFAVAGRAEVAGPKTGLFSGHVHVNGNPMWFYVSASGSEIEDFVITVVSIPCPGGGDAGPQGGIVIDSAAIRADRYGLYFSHDSPQHGDVGGRNSPTKFTIHIAGRFSSSTEAFGTYSETAVVDNDGHPVTCSLKDQTWSAARAEQPSQPSGVGEAGTYRLRHQYGDPASFTVSASRTEMTDLRLPVNLFCNPGDGELGVQLMPISLTLHPDGSFWTTQDQTLTPGNSNTEVTFHIEFKGHFHGVDGTGASRAAGSYQVTGTYPTRDGKEEDCNSNKQWWDAVRAR